MLKTIQQCKDEVAKKYGVENWNDLHFYGIDCAIPTLKPPFAEERLLNEATKLYAESAIKEAAERVALKHPYKDNAWMIDKDSILSIITELK